MGIRITDLTVCAHVKVKTAERFLGRGARARFFFGILTLRYAKAMEVYYFAHLRLGNNITTNNTKNTKRQP
jgi:hypothetical protein